MARSPGKSERRETASETHSERRDRQSFDLEAIRRARVLVVGDLMLDRYWHGDTSRISPEAPVHEFAGAGEVRKIKPGGTEGGCLTTLGTALASVLLVLIGVIVGAGIILALLLNLLSHSCRA